MATVNPSLFYNALTTLTLVSLFTVVVVASFAPAPAPSISYSLATDTQALLRFKATLDDDPYSTLLAWNTTFRTCDWYGVACREDRVVSLNLTACQLLANISTNTLSPLDRMETLLLSRNSFYGAQIGLVASSLRKLDLSFNNLTGNISPRFFANCGNLEWLDLSSNSLSGNLPPSIGNSCKTLAHLNVSNNSLAGLIPANTLSPNTTSLDLSSNNFSGPLVSFFNIGDCSNVTWLDLSSNSLSGRIPPAIASCVQLRHLNVSVNQLDGPLPEEIGSMCDMLEYLDLSHNLQNGSIPLSWGACANLRFLNLVGNNLTGNFPAEAVTGMKSIEKLLLGFNYFTGNLPVSLVENALLEVLDLSSNTFSGEIPAEICGARSLKRLWLQGNGLTGQIPSGIQNCSNLAVLDLSINFLTGGIPDALVSLPYLEDLVLWGNELGGPVPEGICRGGHLFRFIANLNLLTGEIPISLLNCTRLEWLALSGNQLTGQLPEELGLLANIGLIELANNSFTGVVPASLGNCTKLFWLDLNSNRLEGTIPAELVRNSGKIPVGDLRGLSFAYLKNIGSTCKGLGGLLEFTGIRDNLLDRLPILQQCNFTRLYLGNDPYPFSANGSIRYLDLSYNQLVGEIPVAFGTMMWLSAMSLSNNNLTGEIPSTFGNLLRLAVLDLSHNQLLGRIPASLNNLGFLYQLDLSNNQLSGSIPLNGKLSTFPAKVYANNFGLCGEPLPPCGGPNSNSSIMGSADSVAESKSKWKALAIAAAIVVALISVVAVFICTRKTRQKLQETLREQYLDSLSTVKTWSISNANEPLSINVASFEKMLKKLKFAHLLEATNGFSDDVIIGSGGFGDVYKGVLKDGAVVAVKKLLHTSGQGDREFSAEMETIGKIKHRNLVPLLGYCTVGEERLLVYEYMEGGSLEKRLHSPLDGNLLNQAVSPLVWSDRKHIIYGAARGLCFLHHNCIPRIIHRDMKTSNVLLDMTGEARLSDFGMARLVNTMDTHMSATTLAGTPGYIPPEYFQSFRCTTKGDVYSFGVVMLELLTGRRPTHKEEFGDSNLVGWVKQNVAMNTHLHTLDPTLVTLGEEGRRDGDEMSKCLGIALKCLEDRPPKRPTMLEVVAFLRRELFHNDDEETSSSSNNSTSF